MFCNEKWIPALTEGNPFRGAGMTLDQRFLRLLSEIYLTPRIAAAFCFIARRISPASTIAYTRFSWSRACACAAIKAASLRTIESRYSWAIASFGGDIPLLQACGEPRPDCCVFKVCGGKVVPLGNTNERIGRRAALRASAGTKCWASSRNFSKHTRMLYRDL